MYFLNIQFLFGLLFKKQETMLSKTNVKCISI